MDLVGVDDGGKGEGKKELCKIWIAYIPLCLPLPHLNEPFPGTYQDRPFEKISVPIMFMRCY